MGKEGNFRPSPGAWAKTISHNSQQTFLPQQKFNRSEIGFELSLPKNHPSQNE